MSALKNRLYGLLSLLGLRISWLKTDTWLNPLFCMSENCWVVWAKGYLPVLAVGASFFCILRPVKLLTLAHLTKVASKRTNFEEAEKRKEFSDAILHRGTR
jgi:uncharacterized membrane protein YcjF (UPF0283 family)